MRNIKCKSCRNLKYEWCDRVEDSPDPDIVRTCQYYAVETNADHIRAMTDEELLEFLKKTAENVAMCAMLRVEPAFLSLEWLQKPKED